MINKLFQEMEAFAASRKIPIIPPATASLLAEVVRKKKPMSVLEIGTAIGYSTLVMASLLPEQATIITIERDSDRLALAQDYITRAGVDVRVKFICADAGEVLPCLEGPFELIFIDAAKGQYLAYLSKVLDKLLPGAVIVADNVLFRGMVNGTSSRRFRTITKRLREYLDFVTTDPRFLTKVHFVGDGVAVSYYQGEYQK